MSATDAQSAKAATIREPPFGFWRRSYAMLVKEFIQLRRDRVSFAMIVMIPVMQLMLFGYAINTTPRNLPTAVLLQEDSDLGALDPEGAGEHRLFPLHPRSARRRRVRRSPAVGQGAVRRRNPARFRARGAARRPSGAVGRSRRDRSGRGGLGARRARHGGADRAGSTTSSPAIRRRCRSRSGPMRAIIPRPILAAQHRAGPGRHHPDHDHADLHGAVGDARDRARHHGEPAVDADQAGRGDVRQDHPLRDGRLHPGHADRRHRRAAVRGADPRQPVCCWRC